MSDCWIESHTSLRHHPKVRRLARRLQIPVLHAIGILHALWWFTIEHACDGDLSTWDAQEIGDACEYDGSTLVEALQVTGWLDDMRVHDWEDYAGRMIVMREARREQARERQARFRRNALVTRESRVSNAHVTHLPNHTIPNLTKDISQPPAESVIVAHAKKPRDADARTTRFIPPTLDEVTAYCQELKAVNGQAQAFHDYYTGNGWKVGRNGMKDWKATVRNWLRNDRDWKRKPTEQDRRAAIWDAIKDTYPDGTPDPFGEGEPLHGL